MIFTNGHKYLCNVPRGLVGISPPGPHRFAFATSGWIREPIYAIKYHCKDHKIPLPIVIRAVSFGITDLNDTKFSETIYHTDGVIIIICDHRDGSSLGINIAGEILQPTEKQIQDDLAERYHDMSWEAQRYSSMPVIDAVHRGVFSSISIADHTYRIDEEHAAREAHRAHEQRKMLEREEQSKKQARQTLANETVREKKMKQLAHKHRFAHHRK